MKDILQYWLCAGFTLECPFHEGQPPGAGLMNTVISHASGKPSDPLRGYSYVHDSNLRQPRQIAATMHKMLLVTTVLA